MESAQQVDITPLGPASAATVLWRMYGRLHVTVVVKATFSLVPERRMFPIDPDPLALDEQPDPSGRGLWSAGDLAPYRGQCDVLVTGHAELPPSFDSPEATVWLAVVQGGGVSVDKWLVLDSAQRTGPTGCHVHIHGMGPLSREWPRRSQLLGAIDPRRLERPVLDIPDEINWAYFQAAPADQRIEPLRGDEWVVLGGVVVERPKLRTQLPDARAAARIYRRAQPAPRLGEPIKLGADTLHIDVDRRCCSIVWRGYAPLDERDLGSLHVLAGVELPARPLEWSDPFASLSTAPPPRSSQRADSAPLSETSRFSPEDLARLVANSAEPREQGRAPTGARPPPGRSAWPGAVPPSGGAPPHHARFAESHLAETNRFNPGEVAELLAGAKPTWMGGAPAVRRATPIPVPSRHGAGGAPTSPGEREVDPLEADTIRKGP